VVFRDIKGTDIEYLDMVLGGEEKTLTSSQVIELLQYLYVGNPNHRIRALTPRTIKRLYSLVSEHILCNYMSKENWLRQCYSIQNGSFQNVFAMERVPMSKFTAMCMIHKEAMDQIKNETTGIENKV